MHSRGTAGSFAAALNPLAVLGPLASIITSLAGPLPARGVDVPFTEHVISTAATGAWSVFATDVDGDGDTDVLSASSVDDKIAWYENDGGSPPAFTERVISTTARNSTSVFATDVDGDGDTDVLSASPGTYNKIAWYENNGGSPPTFTERMISTIARNSDSVFAADVDGDGDTDVLSASQGADRISWYESDGGSPPTFNERVITEDPDGPGGVEGFANGARSVFATDVDGDGDTDVLSASLFDHRIAWYESDGGSPPAFTERVISTTANHAISVFATDVDGDGDTDVLSASFVDSKIAWYASDGGSPPTFTERVVSTAADAAFSVFATDVDGDGDIDVLSASRDDHKIAWYESDGGSPPTFTERVISTAAARAFSVFATDLDGDGDTDVLSASWADDKIAWYENTTPPCGNGVRGRDEECDDGFTDDCGTCNVDCTGPGTGSTCGDGVLCPEFEECNGGLGCTDCLCDTDFEPTAPPSLDCQPTCGNGSIDTGEECDGMDNSACPGACLSDCTCGSFCGDGVCDPGEDSCNCPDDCGTPPLSEVPGVTCTDGNDNDCDGLTDSTDPDCAGAIPTVSAWGLIIMALLLLTGIKVRFGGRHPERG